MVKELFQRIVLGLVIFVLLIAIAYALGLLR